MPKSFLVLATSFTFALGALKGAGSECAVGPASSCKLQAADAEAIVLDNLADKDDLSFRQLRRKRVEVRVDPATGVLNLNAAKLRLSKKYNLGINPAQEFDVIEITDENMTHSCANYVADGSTVFSRDGKLVLRVSSACANGKCLNSGRIMSKASYNYGLFIFKATVPKCNAIWPALWLLPTDSKGTGTYGTWPCSGEIDVLETVHDDSWGAFNLVSGYGESGTGTSCSGNFECNQCAPPGYCTSTTLERAEDSHYFVEKTDCSAPHPSWTEHTFVLLWQPGQLATWVDPVFQYDAEGAIVGVQPNMQLNGQKVGERAIPSYKVYQHESTPTWRAVRGYMDKCFPHEARHDAPFDKGLKLVLNVAVGGYGGAPCNWNSENCLQECGGAVGSEMIVSDLSVYQ